MSHGMMKYAIHTPTHTHTHTLDIVTVMTKPEVSREIICLLFILQVLMFVKELADLLPDYEMACEHEHSNCVLLSHRKVRDPDEPLPLYGHAL